MELQDYRFMGGPKTAFSYITPLEKQFLPYFKALKDQFRKLFIVFGTALIAP
jgi:hypothetical protein